MGKTEVAKVLAEVLQTELVPLQCYEGLDEARALFEWNYQKQLLRIQADAAQKHGWDDVSSHIFSRDYLLERPLLRAISSPRKIVLLIDEIDKAEEEFEAFLLEVLSDFQDWAPVGSAKNANCPSDLKPSARCRHTQLVGCVPPFLQRRSDRLRSRILLKFLFTHSVSPLSNDKFASALRLSHNERGMEGRASLHRAE